MDYNFTDPLLNYGNLPLDQVNYTTSVCVISQFQEMQRHNEEQILYYQVLTFFVALAVFVEIIQWLHHSRVEKFGKKKD